MHVYRYANTPSHVQIYIYQHTNQIAHTHITNFTHTHTHQSYYTHYTHMTNIIESP